MNWIKTSDRLPLPRDGSHDQINVLLCYKSYAIYQGMFSNNGDIEPSWAEYEQINDRYYEARPPLFWCEILPPAGLSDEYIPV